MRLDFNVLWVEDNQRNVQAQRKKIERALLKEGFRLRVQFASSVKEAEAFLTDDIYGDHIDLVLMDFHLSGGKNGDDGIREVRRHFPYKDIIFYSAQDAADLKKIVVGINEYGVHLSNRGELPDTTEGVFMNLVKKVLDIDHSRGIVMGATSDIDEMVRDSLTCLYEKIDSESKSSLLADIAKRLKSVRKKFDEDFAALEQVVHISEVFEKHSVYTSVDRIRLLRKAMKRSGLAADSDDHMKHYIDNVAPRRNTLAHVHVKRDGFSRKLVDKNGLELTSDQMKMLRADLLRSHNAFETILDVCNSYSQKAEPLKQNEVEAIIGDAHEDSMPQRAQ